MGLKRNAAESSRQMDRMAETEARRLRSWMEAIHSMLDGEIATRFRTSSHLTEEEVGRNSRVYHLLSVPRNMARTALAGEPFLKPSPKKTRKP